MNPRTKRAAEIKSRVSLSSVVSVAVKLKGQSPNFTGLCPFHQEKTPSFHVRDHVGRFKCFGCGASGDMFEFLMRLRGISFLEAMAELSIKAGFSLENAPKVAEGSSSTDDVLRANAIAQDFFTQQLHSDDKRLALTYLQNTRGLNLKMIQQAGLGFAGSSNEFFAHLKKHHIKKSTALLAGLVKEHHQLVSSFHGRITFPIRNRDGKIVAFGARAFLPVDKDSPKYVNTHSYNLYEKRKMFYGWFESQPAIAKGVVPVLVEGYFDAMAMWALGLPALALCGTALSAHHAKMIRTMSARLTICFDADSAGVLALRNSLVELFRVEIEPRLVILDEKDPGAYLENKQLEKLKTALNQSMDGLCYLIDHAAIASREDRVFERIRQIDWLLPVFAAIKRPLVRRQYVAYLAKQLSEEPLLLWNEIEQKVKTELRSTVSVNTISSQASLTPDERLLLEITMSTPVVVKTQLDVLTHVSEQVRKIIEALLNEELDHHDLANALQLIVSRIDDKFWPAVSQVVRNRIEYSDEQATQSLDALKKKLEENSYKMRIKQKRIELQSFERKGDFASVISSLKEKSMLVLSRTRKQVFKIQRNSAKPAALVEDKSSFREKMLVKVPKINDLEQGRTYFDNAEDWH